MKHVKKIVSLLLTLVMLAAMTLTAGAADTTYTITVNDTKAGHTYGAYQIFQGTLDDEGVLSNIDWGSGVNSTALLSALKAADSVAYGSCDNAMQVAKVLETNKDNAAFVSTFAKTAFANLSDASATATVAEGATSCTLTGLGAGYYLVKDNVAVTGNDAATAIILKVVKNETVTPKSSVPTLTKKVKEGDVWQDASNYAVGDNVPFKLTGTMPSTLDTYSTYKYVFHDTLSAGLTLNADSVSVKIGDTDVTGSFQVKTTELADGCSFEVSCDNVKAITGVTKDSAIVVEYTARLNEQAVIAGVGNPNEAYLEFSNNPNEEGTGTTPVDKVTVFTFELVANKVDGDNNNVALPGAQFTLKKKNAEGEYETVKTLGADEEISAFTFTGLAAGEYRLVEDKAPTGYNAISDIDFRVVAVYDTESADPKLTSLTVEGTNADATFTVNKTGEGDDATFTNITTQVVNHKGSTLPSTGGVGTTMFYVIGAILAVGAALLLITRRRMSCEK